MRHFLLGFVIVFVMLSGGESLAQKAGFKLGMNIANSNFKDPEGTSLEFGSKKTLITPRFGVSFEAPIYEGLFVGTGIFTTVKGFKYKSRSPVIKISDKYIL